MATWTKASDTRWEGRFPGHAVFITKSGLAAKPIYDLFVDGGAVRRFPKLNEAKAFAGPHIARMDGAAQPAPKPPRALVGAAAAARAGAAQRAAEGNGKAKEAKACLCGCGEQTKGGTFIAGHDARYKSALVREAIAGNQEAVEALERRGWTKFLDKGRETAARREAAGTDDGSRKQKRERAELEAEQASNALERVAVMKQARMVLIGLGRYGAASGDRRIEMSGREVDGQAIPAVEVAQSIIDGTHPDFADDAERALAAQLGKGN